MPNLNVHVDGAPGPQLVHLSAVLATNLSEPFTIFPSERMTDANGNINFIAWGTNPGFPKIEVTAQCQNFVSSSVVFDGTSDVTINLPYTPFKTPSKPVEFKPMDAFWKGNDCGIHLDYLPFVEGGSADNTLFCAWMYDRYPKEIRDRIRPDYAKKFTHIALSWPDSANWGYSPEEALAIYREWEDVKVGVEVFLTAKGCGYDHDIDGAYAFAKRFTDVAVGIIPAFVHGWEMSLFFDPYELPKFLKKMAPEMLRFEGTLVHIHLQEGYMSFPLEDHDNASFWWDIHGTCHGILLQKRLSEDDNQFTDWLHDCLARFAGEFGMPANNGINDEHIIGTAWELNYMDQFFSGATTESGNHLGDIAIAETYKDVKVMGSGNGYS